VSDRRRGAERGCDPGGWARLLRSRTAQVLVLGMLVLSPMKLEIPSIDPPPAAVLPIGDRMPGLDPLGRRLAASLRWLSES